MDEALKILKRAEETAQAHWGKGWELLNPDLRHASVCKFVIDLLDDEKIRSTTNLQTLLEVLRLAREYKA